MQWQESKYLKIQKLLTRFSPLYLWQLIELQLFGFRSRWWRCKRRRQRLPVRHLRSSNGLLSSRIVSSSREATRCPIQKSVSQSILGAKMHHSLSNEAPILIRRLLLANWWRAQPNRQIADERDTTSERDPSRWRGWLRGNPRVSSAELWAKDVNPFFLILRFLHNTPQRLMRF